MRSEQRKSKIDTRLAATPQGENVIRHSVFLALLIVSGCSQAGGFPAIDNEYTRGMGPVLVDHVGPEYRLAVHGGEARLLHKDCIKGEELCIQVFHRDVSEAVFSYFQGAAYGSVIIDYSQIDAGVLVLTQCEWDPRRTEDNVPFVETALMIHPDGKYDAKSRVVLPPEEGDIAMWKQEVIRRHAVYEERMRKRESLVDIPDDDNWYVALAHLRNVGVGRPDEAVAALRELDEKIDRGDHRGCSCEDIGRALGNVEDVRAVRKFGKSLDFFETESEWAEWKAYAGWKDEE